MKLHTQDFKDRKEADLIILPFFEGREKAYQGSFFESYLNVPIEDFSGKAKETLLLYLTNEKEKRLLLLGLGKPEEINRGKLEEIYGSAMEQVIRRKCKKIHVLIPDRIILESKQELLMGICEGICLANYAFTRLKHDSLEEDSLALVEEAVFIGLSFNANKLLQKALTLAMGVHFIRDLVNTNADDKVPSRLAEVAKELAKESSKIAVTVFDKARIEKEKMGLLLAVSRGASSDPSFIIASFHNNPSKDHTVIIGKGITFDSGGLCLKTSDRMHTMKCDMAGAATALAVIYMAALLDLKVNVTAVVPATENAIGSRSYKPGDVYKGYSKKTVEVNNTDAEGRLILADAISYTQANLKPTRMIDLATLTAAVSIALGDEIMALLTNDEELASRLKASSERTDELLWRLPLHQNYRRFLKSEIADIKNSGAKGAAGVITGALFIESFVQKGMPWAHLDIAGTSYCEEPKGYPPQFGTGVSLSLLIDYLEHL